jgi:two-component system, NarL family, sensor histidine kinase UhpB
MKQKLKILHLEDNLSDSEMVFTELMKADVHFEKQIVDTKEDFIAALKEFKPDIILSDHSLPRFNSHEAFKIVKKMGMHVPFIQVSGAVSEEAAVYIINLGADDCILKDELVKLPAAIDAALKKRESENENLKAQQILVQSEERYRTLVERISDAFIALDQDWRYIYVNKKAGEIARRDPITLIGKNIWKEFPDTVGSDLYNAYHKAMAGQKNISLIYYYESLDLWTENVFYPSPEGISVITRDITERKKAEEAILRERDLIKSIIDRLPDIFYLFDETGKILHWNKNFETVSGYSEAEISTLHPLDLFDVDAKQLVGEKIEEAFTKGMAIADVPLFTKTKEKIPYYFTGWRIIFEGKICLIGMGVDITERKKAEEKLRKSNQRYELVNKATHDTVWEWNYLTKKGLWGDGIIEVFGYSKDRLTYGETWVDEYVHPDDKEEVKNTLHTCIESGMENWQHEYRFNCADGTYKYVFDRGFIRYDEQSKPYRMIGAMTDITEHKRLERELVEQQIKQQKLITETTIQAQEKERNELGKELHDNINQILATAKLYLGMAKSGQDTRQDFVGQSFEFVHEAMQEIRKLSHSLVAPSLGDIGLKEALQELVEDTTSSNGLQIQLFVDEKYNEIDIDKRKELALYRIVQEQLTNIVKYAKAKKVVVTLNTDDCHLFLSIADNGVGFDTTQKSKGIGLKNISSRVEFYSGNINIISAPGQGCTLEVYIPC